MNGGVITCACGCDRTFPEGKPGRKYFDVSSGSPCRQRAWRSRWLRTRPSSRNKGLTGAVATVPKRITSRRHVEVGSIRKALELLARTNPEVLLNLLAAVESPARARIELAG